MKTNIKINHYFSSNFLFIPLALMLLLSMGLSSCNDEAFLEEKAYSILLTSNAYGSVEGIRQGIAGCHTMVRRYWYFGEEIQDPTCIWLGGLGTDIAWSGEDPGSLRFLCNYENYVVPTGSTGGAHGGSPSTIDYFWDIGFRLVQRANYVIDACNDLPEEKWARSGQKEEFIAEAKFFRAWSYRHLTSFFGEIPVIDYATTSPKTDYERESLAKAYALMEEDLQEATRNLPLPGKEENTGRITQGAAWHLLCEVYLAQRKYNEAVQAASNVINNYGYKLMTERFGGKNSVWGTGDVYWDLFAMDNQSIAANTETIWVIQFKSGTSDTYANHRGGRFWGNAYHRLPTAPDGKKPFVYDNPSGADYVYTDTLGRGVALIRPSSYAAYTIWQSDWNNDIRNAPHNIKRDFHYYNKDSEWHGKKVKFSDYDYDKMFTSESGVIDQSGKALRQRNDTCHYIFPFFLKKFDPNKVITQFGNAGHGDSFKDIYGMRLAETYLLRAEAYIALGELGKAADDINLVRTRSKANPVDPADVDIDYLLDEHARELYGETCRHFVLRRTGTMYDRLYRYCDNPYRQGVNMKPYHVLWPIPQSQINLNIHNKWQNNPGYPGGPSF